MSDGGQETQEGHKHLEQNNEKYQRRSLKGIREAVLGPEIARLSLSLFSTRQLEDLGELFNKT